MVQTAISATHVGSVKILSTPDVGYRASEAGDRTCTRSIVFYAWSKPLKRPRMRGEGKYSVLQMWATGLVRGVSVRASGRWYFMRGKNGSKGHACARRREKTESHLITIVIEWDQDFWMSNTEGKTVIQLLSTSFLIQ